MLRHNLISVPTALGNGASVLILDLNVTLEMPIWFPNTLIAVETGSKMVSLLFLGTPAGIPWPSNSVIFVLCVNTSLILESSLSQPREWYFIQCVTQIDCFCLTGIGQWEMHRAGHGSEAGSLQPHHPFLLEGEAMAKRSCKVSLL